MIEITIKIKAPQVTERFHAVDVTELELSELLRLIDRLDAPAKQHPASGTADLTTHRPDDRSEV